MHIDIYVDICAYGGELLAFAFPVYLTPSSPALLPVTQTASARYDGSFLRGGCSGNPDAKRLYDDLLSNYNKLVRPVVNVTDALTVKIKLKLSQLIDVNLKNQIMTTNLWVEQSWYDYKLKWDPQEYGGVEMLHVPSDHIWRPDIVDLRHVDEVKGSNVVDIGVDLTEFYTSVEWDILEVPAVRNEKFYTCCDEPYLDITFNITMRRKTLFYTVNLIIPCMGISFLTVLVFYLPSDSGEKVSLSISILLSLTVFFLLLAEIIPPTSLVVPLLGKFVLFTMILDTFSICVTVVVLNVHFRSPQTHIMAPWVRRVFIHILPRLLVMRRPHYQLDRRSYYIDSSSSPTSSHRVMVRTCNGLELRDHPGLYPDPTDLGEEPSGLFPSASSRDELTPRELEPGALSACRIHGTPPCVLGSVLGEDLGQELGASGPLDDGLCKAAHSWHHCPEVHKAIDGVRFIADHTRREEDSTRVKEDWKYVAMVLDRLFLWIFTLAVLVGTAGIILQAPTLYDDRIPIDVRLSEIASTTAKPHIATSL
ncbi:hypothetical protein Trydic_g8506 [Trypoxylus dichotomus]